MDVVSGQISVIDLPHLPPPSMRASAARVLDVVAESYSITVYELCGRDRHKCVAEARLVAYWLLRSSTRFSFPEIARAIGNRDHTTVIQGVKSCQRRRDSDAWFRSNTDAMLEAIGGT